MAAFVSRYARAFLEVATASKLNTAELEKQFDDFLATWNGSAELQKFFTNPAVSAAQKVAFLDTLNKKLGMRKELRNLIAVLIDNDRIGEIQGVADAWRAELRERLGVKQAEIVTARELSAEERAELVEGVVRLAGAKVEASFRTDTSILGGTVVRIGSTVYDGSVRGRLERLKETLVEG